MLDALLTLIAWTVLPLVLLVGSLALFGTWFWVAWVVALLAWAVVAPKKDKGKCPF